MTVVIAGVAALVTVFCGLCVAMPAWRDPTHRVEVDIAHMAMGAVMVAMILGLLPTVSLPFVAIVFATGLLASVVRGLGRRIGRFTRASYARFAIVCAAMLPMLVPAGPATAATPRSSVSSESAGGHAMAMTVGGGIPVSVARVAGLVLIAALLVVAAERLTATAGTRAAVSCRIGMACEVAMATVMGCLLATML